VLDVGCGSFSMMPFLNLDFTIGVDAYGPSLDEAARREAHNALDHSDIRNIGERYGRQSFDACVALDVIEHLPKNEGFGLIQAMEGIATNRVVIVTPNGFVEQAQETLDAYAEGGFQEHRSGWKIHEMESLGYNVSGIYGLKGLRGAGAQLLYRPKLVTGIVSELTHYFRTRSYPCRAAELVCVKDVNIK